MGRGRGAMAIVVAAILLSACSTGSGDEAVGRTTTTTATTAPSTSSPEPGPRVIAIDDASVRADPAVEAAGKTVTGSLETPDGRTRTYRVHVPTVVAQSDAPVPLLVALHGGLGWGAQYERNSGYDGLAEANGFIVVYPDGYDAGIDARPLRTWNGGACCGPAARLDIDDVGFISQLIDQLEDEYPVDADQVVATGHSNGGILALRLGCEIADQISAIGIQSSALEIDDCHPAQPVSLLQIHGSADQNLPIDGGIGEQAVSGVSFDPPRQAAEAFAAADDCPDPPTTQTSDANPDVTATIWSPCADGTDVVFLEVDGASHAWMGHPTGGSGLTGPPYEDLDASLVIWDFLRAHTPR